MTKSNKEFCLTASAKKTVTIAVTQTKESGKVTGEIINKKVKRATDAAKREMLTESTESSKRVKLLTNELRKEREDNAQTKLLVHNLQKEIVEVKQLKALLLNKTGDSPESALQTNQTEDPVQPTGGTKNRRRSAGRERREIPNLQPSLRPPHQQKMLIPMEQADRKEGTTAATIRTRKGTKTRHGREEAPKSSSGGFGQS